MCIYVLYVGLYTYIFRARAYVDYNNVGIIIYLFFYFLFF